MSNKKNKKKKNNLGWVLKITLAAFLISFLFSFGSETLLPNVNVGVGVILVILVIAIGILFDMIGVAVTTADEKPFHSMSAKKIKEAKVAVILKKNAEKVSSFCNDVIGDICGIISGSGGIIIATALAHTFQQNYFIVALLVTATIAALTIGGKAFGKGIAIHKSNQILHGFSKVIAIVDHPKEKRVS